MILQLVRDFQVSKCLYDAFTCLLICVKFGSWLLMDWFKFKGLKELDVQESKKTDGGIVAGCHEASRVFWLLAPCRGAFLPKLGQL